ncbi:hypothetical protein ACHWQZ_G018191 [Mnemiopsis leidyi]
MLRLAARRPAPLYSLSSASPLTSHLYHPPQSRSLSLSSVFSPEKSVASPKFTNRWAIAVPAFLTHLCIGAPYAWSAMSGPLTRDFGFVCSSAEDWSMTSATAPMSILFAFHGFSAALAGKWQMKVGPRTAIAAAAISFGGGFLLSAVGVATHNIGLVYFGYGVLGGIGLGLSYTPPIQTLIEWFPDKKGLASGLTIMGFGSGALLFAPAANVLLEKFSSLPTYLGTAVETITENGRLFAESGGKMVEVVYANAADLAKLSTSGLQEGFYVVGSGDTGAAMTLATIGVGYTLAMMGSALAIKKPHPTYKVTGSSTVTTPTQSQRNVHTDNMFKLPQFYALGTVLVVVASGGMGLIGVAKPLMSEVFSGTLPSIVTASFASSFILMLSVGNLGGRLAWAAVSDKIGRPATFHLFTFGSIAIYASLPTIIQQVIQHQSAASLGAFCGLSVAAISMFGGVYSILPAYESDLFGTKYVGANHGKMLLFSSTAAIAGPSAFLYLRSLSEKAAITDLLSKIDPSAFKEKFGSDVSALDAADRS